MQYYLRIPLFLSIILAIFSITLHGAEETDLLDTLGKQLQAYATAHAAGSDQDANRIRMIIGMGEGLDQALAQGDTQSIQAFLGQIGQMPDLPADLKTTITQLQSDLPKLMEEADDKYVTDVDAMLTKTHQACLDAKVENDLDPMLKDLGTLRRPRNGSNSPLVQRQMAKIDAAIQFVTRWQDALAQRDAGNLNSANEIMHQLANDSHYPILTQDEIRTHTPPKEAPGDQVAQTGGGRRGGIGNNSAPTPVVAEIDPVVVNDILVKIKSFDELDAASLDLGKLSQLSQGRQGSPNQAVAEEASAAKSYVSALQTAYADYQQGFYDEALRSSTSVINTNQHDWIKEIVRLRGAFIKMILPKYLALPGAEKPAADENAMDFLLRMSATAYKEQRWSDLLIYLNAYRLFGFGTNNMTAGSGTPTWLTTDIANCQDFVGAQNLEATGNLVEAITAYQRILLRPGNYSPTGETMARMQTLQKDHPDAYQEALKLAETQISTDEFHQQILSEVQQMIRVSGARGFPSGGAGRGLPAR
jgi:tetratricopeptide (TPR) repeat protein